MTYRVLTLFVASVFLSGCGEDTPAPQAAKVPAMENSAPAVSVPLEEIVVSDDDEITYDAIDVSKLDNQWWRQYSGEGG